MRSGARPALAVIIGATTGRVCVMNDATDCISSVAPRAATQGFMPSSPASACGCHAGQHGASRGDGGGGLPARHAVF